MNSRLMPAAPFVPVAAAVAGLPVRFSAMAIDPKNESE